jgi:hypothetical protein
LLRPPTPPPFLQFKTTPLEQRFENESDIRSAQCEAIGETAIGTIRFSKQVQTSAPARDSGETPVVRAHHACRMSYLACNRLENDGRLEHAQQMAGHESPRTTKLYDRTKDEITLSEVERIRL